MSSFLELTQSLTVAMKAVQMYTGSHPRTQEAVARTHGLLEHWLGVQERLQIVVSAGKVFLDGQLIDDKSPHLTMLVRQVSERGLNGFLFDRGISPEEFLEFLQVLVLKPQQIEEQGGFEASLKTAGVTHVRVSQVRYEAVREGEGDGREDKAPAFEAAPKPASPSPPPDNLVKFIREALLASMAKGSASSGVTATGYDMTTGTWPGLADHHGLSGAQTEGLEGGTVQYLHGFHAADLSGLGSLGYQLGLGDGMPTVAQLSTLRQVLMSLSSEVQLNLLAGLATLPPRPEGLSLGVKALAGELLSSAIGTLLGKGASWNQLTGPLQDILRPLPDKEALVRALAVHLRSAGMDGTQAEALLRRMEWESLSLEAKLVKVLEEGHLFELSLEQRLAFLRELLDLRRFDAFSRIQDIVLEVLRSELMELRLKALQTLAGISRWARDPGLPTDIETPLAEAMRAHFGWEPDPPLHRWTLEALESLLTAEVRRGQFHHVMADLRELEDLCAFAEEQQPWRKDGLATLKNLLNLPALLESATSQLFSLEKDQLTVEVFPYFEFVGAPMARHLVTQLGEESDRARRGRIVEGLRSLGTVAVPPLLEALGSPAWYLVRNVLTLLSDLGDAGCLPQVIPLLKHPEPRVRRTAVRALWRLGGPASEPHILARLKDSDPETQQEILFALGQMKSEGSLPQLTELAQDKKAPERLRIQALDTLGHIGSPKALPVLCELLRRKGFFGSSEPLPLRLAAAKALVATATPEATLALQKVLDAEPKGEDRQVLLRLLQP